MKKPKIVYISTGSPELKKAHAIQTFHTAKSLAKKSDVTLVYPLTVSSKNVSRLKLDYRKAGVNLKLIPTTSLGAALKSPRLFIIDKKIFASQAARFARASGADAIITRDPVVAAKTYPDIFEIHKIEHMLGSGKTAQAYKQIELDAIKNSKAIVAISKWLFEYCKRLNPNAYLVPDAYEPDVFKKTEKTKARKRLGVNEKEKIAMYSGLTFREGVSDFVKGAKSLPKVKFYLVGGDNKVIEKLKKRAGKNVIFTGRIPFGDVPTYLSAADVLVLPYKPSKFNDLFSSPLKLFEYMGMGKPIVATDVGCFQGILGKGNSKLVKPGAKFIAGGIKEVLNNKALASRIARKARKDSAKYTYAKRARAFENILKSTR